MGYRTRRRAEYCIILQKQPRRAKGVWKTHNIPDVIQERASQREHPHTRSRWTCKASLCVNRRVKRDHIAA